MEPRRPLILKASQIQRMADLLANKCLYIEVWDIIDEIKAQSAAPAMPGTKSVDAPPEGG